MNQLPAAGLWTVDPTRTTASFEAANFIVNRVPGTITVRAGAVTADPHGRPTGVTAVLESQSISTGNARRDKDLRSARFLDVANHPVMSFTSTAISADSDGEWTIEGELAVKDNVAPLRLRVELRHSADEDTVHVVARGEVDRAVAGIKAPAFVIGRTVRVTIDAVLSPAPNHIKA